jgi:hypothetical protein
MVSTRPSVGIVLHHTQLDSFIIVRQFRPAVRVMLPSPHRRNRQGLMLEHILCKRQAV